MRSITKFGVGAFLAVGLLGCPDTNNGNLFFFDNEAALLDGPNNQKFALGDSFDFKVTVVDGKGIILDDTFTSQSSVDGIVQVDSTTFSDGGSPDLDDDSLRVQGTALAAGDVAVQVLDVAGTVIDFVNLEVIAADEVLVQPKQFDINSEKSVDALNIFFDSNVPLFTLLRNDSRGINLRGQVAGTADTDDPLNVGLNFVQDVAFELGEKFVGALNGTEQSLVSVSGLTEGASQVLTFTDAASTFLKAIPVNVIALDDTLVDLDITSDGSDPAAPVAFGSVKASSRLIIGGAEVFGGTYSFVEVTPNASLLSISPAQDTGDFITFTALNAGEALVEVCLTNTVGGAGNCVDGPVIISVHVAP